MHQTRDQREQDAGPHTQAPPGAWSHSHPVLLGGCPHQLRPRQPVSSTEGLIRKMQKMGGRGQEAGQVPGQTASLGLAANYDTSSRLFFFLKLKRVPGIWIVMKCKLPPGSSVDAARVKLHTHCPGNAGSPRGR